MVPRSSRLSDALPIQIIGQFHFTNFLYIFLSDNIFLLKKSFNVLITLSRVDIELTIFDLLSGKNRRAVEFLIGTIEGNDSVVVYFAIARDAGGLQM